MEFLIEVKDFLFQLVDPEKLNQLVQNMGPWLYLVLFAIVFCETGLVVTPFLPGDSLLFAVGAVAAIPDSPLSIPILAVVMIVAGVLGDAVNYLAGYYIGPKVFRAERSWLLNRKHLLRAQGFYERHGGKTIILARFVPIIRTFAPFVAGIGKMEYRRFASYNVIGAVAWVLSFLLAGYFLANVPGVMRNFHIIIVAILIVSVMPMVIEFIRARRAARAELTVPVEAK